MTLFPQRRLPAETEDRAQYLACESNDTTIRMLLFYPGCPEPDIMRRAAMHLVQGVDILHARFQAGFFRAGWTVEREAPPEAVFTCRTLPGGLDAAAEAEMLRPVPFGEPCQLRAALLTAAGRSALVLRVGHICADGGDAGYLLHSLLALYNCLAAGQDPDAVALKNGSRSLRQCMAGLDKAQRRRAWHSGAAGTQTVFAFPEEEPGRARLIHHTLPPDLMAAARRAAKAQGATVNDLLLAAYYRAAARRMALPPGQPMGIQSMLDLRRHIPGGQSQGVCNLSGTMPTCLPGGVQGGFDRTLAELAAQTARSKQDPLAGLYGLPAMGALFRLAPIPAIRALGARNYSASGMALTNLGSMRPEALRAGAMQPTGLLFGGPLKQKPVLQLAAASLGDTAALCATLRCTDRDAAAVGALLAAMQQEIEEFAG